MTDEKEVNEIQAKIIQIAPKAEEKVSKEEFLGILKTISPGTNLRTALDEIVRAEKGAIIAIGNEELEKLMDGGFRVNCRFTPQRLLELSKMDGAIILSKDMKKILNANVLLTPDSTIKTNETGTRHKAAERTAKQISGLVIAISERKHEITLYYKNIRHIIKNTNDLLRKANEHVQILEKQRELFDIHIEKLNNSEVNNSISLTNALEVIQRGRTIQKISNDLKKSVVELGNEGTLIKTRLKEITMNVEKETDMVIKDYSKVGLKKAKFLIETLTYDELLDLENIKKAMAYESAGDLKLIKGWRILSKALLIEPEIAYLIKELGSLKDIMKAPYEKHKEILGEDKANLFRQELEKIKQDY